MVRHIYLKPQVKFLTLIDKLQLRNDMQADIGVFVFEHLKEHWKKMSDSPVHTVRKLQ